MIPVKFDPNTNLESLVKALRNEGLELSFNQKTQEFEVHPIEKEPADEAG